MHSEQKTLKTITELCTSFFEDHHPDKNLRKIIDTCVSLTGADRGSLFLFDRTQRKRHLVSMIATGMEGKKIDIDVPQGIVSHVFKSHAPLIINDVSKDPRFYDGVDKKTGYTTKSILCCPLRAPSGEMLGVIEILNKKDGEFSEFDLEVLQLIAFLAGTAIHHHNEITTLRKSHESLKDLHHEKIKNANVVLNSNHPELQEILDRVPTYAQSEGSVLIYGESGTGKEVLSQHIHFTSDRKNSPFIAVNCASIPETLFEAELFGVVEGAATGTKARKGKFEMANGGTILLDEIGELPLSMQAKLLRVLQEKQITPLGSDQSPIDIDFRLIAATNRDLKAMVQEGTFREDLYYRLDVISIRLPNLSKRINDIPMLAESIVAQLCSQRGNYKKKKLSSAAIAKLQSYSWPGNIRQLQNKIEGAIILSGNRETVEAHDIHLESTQNALPENVLPITGQAPTGSISVTLSSLQFSQAEREMKAQLVDIALKQTRGNKTRAAKLLGISREGLRLSIKRKVA